MKKQTKETIFKFILINAVLPSAYIVICGFFTVFLPFTKITVVLLNNLNYAYILFFTFGSLMVITSLAFNIEFGSKTAKPQKKELLVKSHEDFIENVSRYLLIKKFDECKFIDYGSFSVKIFNKVKGFAFFKRIDFIIFVKKERLEKSDLELFDYKITELVKESIDSFKFKPNVYSFTSVICVDKDSADFHKYVTTNMRQSFEIFKLAVGISYEDSKIFITSQNDGPAILQYKKLKKFFMQLLDNCNY